MAAHEQLVTAALEYANLGYPVFPCAPGQKTPLTPHGFYDATTDKEQIITWWNQHPLANVAIATAGLLVVDVDTAWPEDEEHAYSLAQARAISVTPRGGRHYIFRCPEGKNWSCTAGQLASGVDTRSTGGYILVPPSIVSDRTYSWVPGAELDCPVNELSEPPEWLIELLDAIQYRSASQVSQAVVQSPGNQIAAGQRNVALTRLAGVMRRVGMTRDEICAALLRVNQDRCQPPLDEKEVRRIAASVAHYEPDQIATLVAEAVDLCQHDVSIEPISVAELLARYSTLRDPVVHGLLRVTETMNIIAPPKTGKSWLVIDLALAVATGATWLGAFPTSPGNVLVLDNELHPETLAHRIPRVAAARQIAIDAIAERVFVQTFRGQRKDIFSMANYFRAIEPGRFRLVILDSLYRFLPGLDENNNLAIASVYNLIDQIAEEQKCAFVVIHHTSKGNQSHKTITDVGAGAGSQSRATDTHLILRAHEEDDAVVLEAVTRSWPTVPKMCLRWAYPVWIPADDLDPEQLRRERRH